MKKVLAVIVSIFWLVLIIGIPALVLSGNARQFIPAQIQDQLTQLVGQDLLDRFSIGGNEPTTGVDEPVVVAGTVTPVPAVEPTATPIEPPAPTPIAESEPQPEPTNTPVASIPESPSVAIPVAVRSRAELRTGPGLDFDAVGLVDAGATILVSAQDETGEWFLMENGNWIPGEALASKPSVPIVMPNAAVTPEAIPTNPPVIEAPATPATPVVVRVNADANLRSGPGSTFDRVGGVYFRGDVTVVGKFATDNWYLLDSSAWIFGKLLESAPDVPQVNADGTPVGSAPASETTPAATAETVTPTTPTANSIANLRAAPAITATVTGSTQPGQALSIVGKNAAGDWLKLESGSWIFTELVDNASAHLPVASEDAVVNSEATGTSRAANGANLRSGPGIAFDLVGSIAAGTALTVVGRDEAGDWLKLENGAWIFGESVENPPADLPVATQ